MSFFFFLTTTSSPILCPTTQFDSDISSSELVQIPQVRGSVPQDCLPWGTICKSWRPPVLLTINWGFPQPLLRFCNLLEWLGEPRGTLYWPLLVYYKGYNPGTAKGSRYRQGLGRSTRFHALAPHTTTLPALWCDVFTNLEDHWISLFGSFYRA